jgi:transcriptional regulator
MTLYIPSHFRIDDRDVLREFIEANAFGTLVTAGPGGLHVSHIPFIVETGEGASLRLLGHVARANPQAKALESATHVVAIFQGPHGYVSPTWYENHPAVPTWNYAVAHVHGRVTPMDDAGLRDLVSRLAAKYEAGRPNAWSLEGAPADFIEKLLHVITGFSIAVERIEGKFKLSQNRPGDDAKRVIEALEREGETDLARLMREHLPAREEVKSKA